MSQYNLYYLPYAPLTDTNYIYLLCLYGIAEKQSKLQAIKNTIYFSSYTELQQRIQKKFNISISSATISRFLNNQANKEFFNFDKQQKKIILKNDFSNANNKNENKRNFVRLSSKIYNLLLQQNDNFLCKYVIYLVYCCGFQSNKADFTANQFLTAFSYCTKANNYKNMLSKYNALLVDNNILSINTIYLNGSKKRNIYSLLENEYR